jgi:FkbM family methyltransferase
LIVPSLKSLIPGGAERFLGWNAKFRELGFSRRAAFAASADVKCKEAYEQSRIGHLPSALGRGLRFVVDIGANTGQWSAALLTVAQPQRMEVFEPNPEAFAALSQRLGGRPGVRLHPIGVGAERGELPLQVTDNSEFTSFLRPVREIAAHYGASAVTVSKQLRVCVEPLDGVLLDSQPIDLLKIDVQGYERGVIKGAHDCLARTRAVLIEANFVRHYEGDDSLDSLIPLLREHGFGLWDLSPPRRAVNGRPLWCDAVFMNEALLPLE